MFGLSFLSKIFLGRTKEYCTVHGRPGLLGLVGFGSSPTPSPLSCQQVASPQSSCVSPVELTDGRGGGKGGGRGAKSYIIQLFLTHAYLDPAGTGVL
jgi:hypothetical protein